MSDAALQVLDGTQLRGLDLSLEDGSLLLLTLLILAPNVNVLCYVDGEGQ